MRRDQAYQAYLKEHPNGNFARFSQISQAGKRSYGDPTARQQAGPPHPVRADPVGPVAMAARAEGGSLKELRRKIAWAVGSTYGVKYLNYDSWPADYARRASERLLELHGEP